jgi:phage terminase large subunit-like protein
MVTATTISELGRMGQRVLIDYAGVEIDPSQQLLEMNAYDCEESFSTFTRSAWKQIDPAPFRDGWPLEAIAEHLEAVVDGQITRLIINIPPRSGKSTLCSVCFPSWVWCQAFDSPTSGPGCQFVYGSYAEKLSLRFSLRNRRLINTRWYQQRWGKRFALLTDENTAHRFANDRGGERLVTSIGGTATGFGGNIFMIDDPNAANEAFSEAAIAEVIDWWDTTASTRLNDLDAGSFVIIQQRLAENDLTGHVLEQQIGEWQTLILPMHYDADRYYTTSIGWSDPRATQNGGPGEGALLWPERFSDRAVKLLEQTLGPFAAAGQLEQSPKPKGGGVIKYAWWNAWEAEQYPPMDFILASLDTAYTERTENDYSALTVWGIWSHGVEAVPGRYINHDGRPVYMGERTYDEPAPRVMLMHAWQKRLALHELVTTTADTCKRMKVDLLLIENKASGISVSQEMVRLYATEPWGVELNDPKSADKLSRLHSVVPLFAPELKEKRDGAGRIMRDSNGEALLVPVREGIVYAPSLPGMPTFRVWAEEVCRQVESFPHGAHDDLVDTVSQALRWLRDRGMLTLPAERLVAIEEAKQYTRQPEPLYPGT